MRTYFIPNLVNFFAFLNDEDYPVFDDFKSSYPNYFPIL